MTRKDPFAGLRLSEQASPTGKLDQQLFVNRPAPKPNPPKSEEVSRAEPSTSGQVLTSVPTVDVRSKTSKDFDLLEQPLYKATYNYTQDELEALEDLRLELSRALDRKVTKNEVLRVALHLLIEDHRKDPERSYIRRKIAGTPQR